MSQMEDVCVSVNVRRYLFLERMERVQTKGAEYCELGQFTNGRINRFDRSPNPYTEFTLSCVSSTHL